MSYFSLLRRTLLYHWRTNLAVLLGVVVGTAVVGGALTVGDSVRGSLRDITLPRLGRVEHVLTGPRFVREALAGEMGALPEFAARFSALAPAIVLQGTLEKPGAGPGTVAARAGQVTVYALDERAWELIEHGAI